MTQLPTLQTSQTPSSIDRGLGLTLSRLHNALGGIGSMAADDAPTPEVRQALRARVVTLDGWLSPIGEADARVMVAAILAVQPVQGGKGDQDDADKVQRVYARALGDLPRFALRHACATALRYGIGGKTFAPSPAQIREAAETYCRDIVVERRKIEAVLTAQISAPICSPERKALVLQEAKDLVKSMRSAAEGERRGGMSDQEIREARIVSEMVRTGTPDPRPLPRLSPALRASLKLPPEPERGRFAEHAA